MVEWGKTKVKTTSNNL